MEVNQTLIRLAQLFQPQATLYVVGGYLRNKKMGLPTSDLDICARLLPNEVKDILKGTEFCVSDKALRLGTITIHANNFYAEYTTFRKDSYEPNGKHTPNEVSLNATINEDALRRDFTVNSIYYDIVNDDIVDLCSGINDLQNKIIRTVDNPDIVFGADGLRILRMIRFACQLGFDIDPVTYESAKRNAWRVKDISVERIRDELDKIFTADVAYPTLKLKEAHLRGIKLLDDLGLLDLILPEVTKLKGVAQPKKYHLFDAFNHTLQAFKYSAPNIRWAILLHDIGKPLSIEQQGNMHDHVNLGVKAATKILKRLKFSNEQSEHILKLIENHMFDLDGQTKITKVRRFLVQNQDIAEDLALVKAADYYGTKCCELETNRLQVEYDKLLHDGTPLSLKDLPINGDDLIKMGIEEKKRSVLLNMLWMETVNNIDFMDRDRALNYIMKMEKNV